MLLHLPQEVHEALLTHLLPMQNRAEEAAFVFARPAEAAGSRTLEHVEWLPVPPEGFAARSRFHFELNDATRAAVIKRAHDLRASLIEFHSHHGPLPAEFSASDWAGFEEFVPHVRWRLRGRPYAGGRRDADRFRRLRLVRRSTRTGAVGGDHRGRPASGADPAVAPTTGRVPVR